MAKLIAIGGMSGSGKTTVAEALAKAEPDSIHLDSDRIRKEIFGVPETTRLPDEAYAWDATKKMIEEMARRTKEGLKAGKTVILSSTFASERAREDQIAVAKECKAEFIGIWLEADLQTLFNRVANRTNNPSDAGVDIVQKQAERYARPEGWPLIDAGKAPEEVANEVKLLVQVLSAPQQKPKGKSIKP